MSQVSDNGYIGLVSQSTVEVSTLTSAAIQDAIDHLGATGGVIQLLQGQYTFTSTVNVNKPNVFIQGKGKGVTTCKSSVVSGTMFYWNSTAPAPAVDLSTLIIGGGISDLTMYGPGAGIGTTDIAIRIHHVRDFKVEDVRFHGCSIGVQHKFTENCQLVRLSAMKDGTINNGTLILSDLLGTPASGWLENSVLASDCVIYDPIGAGFTLYNPSGSTFKNCKAKGVVGTGFSVGIVAGDIGQGGMDNIKFEGCSSTGGNYGFYVYGLATFENRNILFSNCTVNSVAQIAFSLVTTRQAVIKNCYTRNTGANAVYMDGAYHTTIGDCHFVRNNTAGGAANVSQSIRFVNSQDQVTITGCKFLEAVNAHDLINPSTQLFFIFVNNTYPAAMTVTGGFPARGLLTDVDALYDVIEDVASVRLLNVTVD